MVFPPVAGKLEIVDVFVCVCVCVLIFNPRRYISDMYYDEIYGWICVYNIFRHNTVIFQKDAHMTDFHPSQPSASIWGSSVWLTFLLTAVCQARHLLPAQSPSLAFHFGVIR